MNTEDRLKELTKAARVESTATEAEWNVFSRRAHRTLMVRRAAAVTGALALIGVAALSAGALTSDDANNRLLQPVSPETDQPDKPATVRVPASEFDLWFVQDERLSKGSTVMGGNLPSDLATDDPTTQHAAYWLRILFAGAIGPYQEAGDTSAIPDGTELLGVAREGSVLEVDVSSRFESGGGSLSMQMRVAQLVYTGTQFEDIEGVRILIDGQRVETIGGEGVDVSEPLTRRDFQDVAPFIVVESPKPGEDVTSPVTVNGFANVFEATVNIVIRDKSGDALVETFTTATCGTGCWGDFSEGVAFEVGERQRGRIDVLTYSAEDGSEQSVVSIPVVLLP
ncbi:MAG: Gmad2 immunoglobulin-like domain-containing protein [Actinomycetota bacterium]